MGARVEGVHELGGHVWLGNVWKEHVNLGACVVNCGTS